MQTIITLLGSLEKRIEYNQKREALMKKLRLSNALLFFKDKNGNIVLWQRPNIPLYGWVLTKFFALIVSNPSLKTSFSSLSTSLLFVWAYLEFTKGVNYFRRSLGLIVITVIISGYFVK